MINWRTILGLILLIVGVERFYNAYAGASKMGQGFTMQEAGCLLWVLAGAYFLVRGISMGRNS